MRRLAAFLFCAVCLPFSHAADLEAGLKSVPRLQVIPLPYDQASFQFQGSERIRYHYGPSLKRPFLYPIMGFSQRSLTRMGHPRDQESHSHHNSFWVSHHDINGVDFWSDNGEGEIRHRRIIEFEDGDERAFTLTENEWVNGADEVLLRERRKVTMRLLPEEEWMVILDLTFEAAQERVTLGDTPFGMVGVRMAKTIGVHDGGGKIRNAAGGLNEDEIFRKPTRWVDYSGRITNDAIEGLTLMDHPSNPNFPAPFHVRNDGWMGACLNHQNPITLQAGETLSLRYGLYVHRGWKTPARLNAAWQQFTEWDE